MTPQKALTAIDDVIAGDRSLHGWEELVQRKHSNPLVAKWGRICRSIEELYHIPGSGVLISEYGVDVLRQKKKEFQEELRNSDDGNYGDNLLN